MDDDIPDDVKKQALDAVGTMANTMPSAPQLEGPPAPVEGLPPPQLGPSEFDNYNEVLMADLVHESPDSGMGEFLVEDVDPAEPITPLPTPHADIEPD